MSENVDSLNRLDRACVGELLKFGKAHFGEAWKPVQVYEEEFGGDAQHLQLFLPWAVYMYEIDGHTAASRYVALHGKEFGEETQAWLAAQAAAYLSIFEVTDTRPGVGLEVRDHLTDATHFVHEARASLSLSPGDAVCARVVTFMDVTVFCGVHHVAINAASARSIAEEVGTALGLDNLPAPAALMRSQEAIEEVLLAWEAAIEQAEKDAQLVENAD